MEMTVRMPANYNLMTEEEMTYTDGGISFANITVLNVVNTVLVAAAVVNWLDMLSGARQWVATNKTGDLGTDIENAVNAWVDYTTSSVWNGVRSVLGTMTGTLGTVWVAGIMVPYGLICSAIGLLTA